VPFIEENKQIACSPFPLLLDRLTVSKTIPVYLYYLYSKELILPFKKKRSANSSALSVLFSLRVAHHVKQLPCVLHPIDLGCGVAQCGCGVDKFGFGADRFGFGVGKFGFGVDKFGFGVDKFGFG